VHPAPRLTEDANLNEPNGPCQGNFTSTTRVLFLPPLSPQELDTASYTEQLLPLHVRAADARYQKAATNYNKNWHFRATLTLPVHSSAAPFFQARYDACTRTRH
jgi:hypothetical protein